MARLQYAIGSSLGTMDYFFNIGVKAPRNAFKPFSRAVEAGNLNVKGQGFGTDLWDWQAIEIEQRNILKAFCPNLSSTVWIRTYNDSLPTPAWEVYRARMIWTPEAEDRQYQVKLKLSINLRLLELIP